MSGAIALSIDFKAGRTNPCAWHKETFKQESGCLGGFPNSVINGRNISAAAILKISSSG